MTTIKKQSLAMCAFRKIGLPRIAWSLRRLYVPVNKHALVLEVGAGGNPYPRANVLLDAYETTVERIEPSLVKDRPFVIGLAEKLPFKNKSFDFIIASHVLEHSHDPDSFLKELMRVGKSGYIETPDAFWERVNPFTFHRLEVTDIDSKISIYKKPSWRHDEEVVDLFERKLKNGNFLKYLSKYPEPVHTRFYWADDIDYEILNPEVRADWPIPVQSSDIPPSIKPKMRTRLAIRTLVRWFFSQRNRNRNINLNDLLICPVCDHDTLTSNGKTNIKCNNCGTIYALKNGIPIMVPCALRGSKENTNRNA